MLRRAACGIVLAAAAVAVLASSAPATITELQVPLQSALGVPERGDSNLAIDGDTSTFTYTTPSFNSQDPSYLEVFFFETSVVNRFRIFKSEYLGPQDWTLQYYSDGAWSNVTGMENGWQGGELVTADAVNSDGSILADVTDTGWESLTFDPVEADGLRVEFHHAPSEDCCNHFLVYEVQAYDEDPGPTTTVNLDPAAPDGSNGWYVSDVTATVAAETDDPSGVNTIRCGLDPVTAPTNYSDLPSGDCGYTGDGAIVSDEGEHKLYGAALDGQSVAGDVASSDIKIDKTAPSAPTAVAFPTPNANGWNNSNVTVSYTDNGDTGGSGVDSCTGDQIVLVEGETVEAGTCTDVAGNVSGDAQTTVLLDKTAPAAPTAHVSPTPNAAGWNNTDVTVSYTDNGDGIGSGISSCSDDAHLTAETTGTEVDGTCTDLAGNESDQTATTVKIDKTAPNTSVDSHPRAPSGSTSAAFSFSGNETSTFQCRLDDGAFSACTSPKSYTDLSAGSHTFRVRAIDVAGNVDPSAAMFTWTIDLTAPDTTLSTHPASPTKSTSASFGFTSTESHSTFECKLDSAAFAACTSAKAYTGLAAGAHTFRARATDQAGNTDATPVIFNWTIDLTAPDTNLTSHPANPAKSTSASFGFTSTKSHSTFECKLDSAAFAACTSAKAYTGLAAGGHTFHVRAIDQAGNVDGTPAVFTWTIDTTPPNTTISSHPAASTTSHSASFGFSSTEAHSTFECKLDGGAFAACSSAKAYSGLAAGNHTFRVRAIDAAGNVDPTPTLFTWTIKAS